MPQRAMRVRIPFHVFSAFTLLALVTDSSVAVAQPKIVTNPANVAFGAVLVNSTTTWPLSVSNAGNAPLTISSMTDLGMNGVFGFLKKPPVPPIVIAPGDSMVLFLTFTPPAAGAYTGELVFQTDDPTAKMPKVPLDGAGVLPGLSIEPGYIVFPLTTTGTKSAPIVVSVANRGMLWIPVQDVRLTGANTNQFQIDSPAAFVLRPGESRSIPIVCAPVTPGAFSAVLVIAPQGANLTSIHLTCTGTLPPVRDLTMSSLDFGRMGDAGDAAMPQPVGGSCDVGRRTAGAYSLILVAAFLTVLTFRVRLRRRDRLCTTSRRLP